LRWWLFEVVTGIVGLSVVAEGDMLRWAVAGRLMGGWESKQHCDGWSTSSLETTLISWLSLHHNINGHNYERYLTINLCKKVSGNQTGNHLFWLSLEHKINGHITDKKYNTNKVTEDSLSSRLFYNKWTYKG